MSQIRLASKTLQAIEDALCADQGASFRQLEAKVLPHIGDAYQGPNEGFRSHLGGSLLGTACGRALWYGFRWFTKSKFNGKTLRLFNRGHLEEGRFIALLLMIGVQVYQQDANGNQFRISSLGGHLGGSGDGIAVGIPDLPANQPALLEFKTHNDASFKKLKSEGVRSAKFEHFVQMCVYMLKMEISVALYLAVNKNSDEIYGEIVTLDPAVATQSIDRGHTIILHREPPQKIAKSVGSAACMWCNHKPVCWLKTMPERNCRSCVHSYAYEDGTWRCNVPIQPIGEGADVVLSKEMQLKGCDKYTPFEPS